MEHAYPTRVPRWLVVVLRRHMEALYELHPRECYEDSTLGRSGWDRLRGLAVMGHGGMSLVAFMLYRHDERAAQGGKARTRERTLHLADLLGGWPGGLLAQDRLRHKTRKAPFQLVFWATVALNCGALGWLLAEAGPYVRP